MRYNAQEQVGKLRERIAIQTATTAANAYGEQVETWATLATVWAQVEYRLLVSDEEQRAGRLSDLRTVHYTIRSRSDFNEKARIVYDSKTYDITAISITPDKQFMTLETQSRE